MSEETHKNELTQEQKMARGTFWMTSSNFLSRLLGVVYIIPWYSWMGQYGAEANALFGMGYNIYALFLLISTSGLNVAVAKQISKYNTLGKEDFAMKLVQGFLKFTLLLGIIFSAIMYIGAPLLARMSGGTTELVPVLRSLTLAVLVFPAMSIMRGIFQGYNDMKPYALSQIAEQLIRVIWMLVTAYMIMMMGSGDYHKAVVQSTFAAFIGMIASVVVLFYFLFSSGLFGKIFFTSYKEIEVNSWSLLVETLKEAIPFIITGSAIQIFQLIDQGTFINFMERFTNYSKTELTIMFSFFSANPNKIVMMIISIATSIGGVGIALLTENYVKGDMKAAARLVINNIQMLMLVVFPAVVGSLILAKPLYTVFYGVPSDLALYLFLSVLIQTVFACFYAMLSPMLQALFENRLAVRYFIYGLVTKLVLQVPFIYFFHSLGPVLSTLFALLVPSIFIFNRIQQVTRFNRKLVIKHTILIVLMTAIMAALVALVNWLMGMVFLPNGRLTSMIYLVVGGSVGVFVYGYLALFTRMVDKLIGARAERFRQMLRIR